MAEYTENLNLIKPGKKENYNVDVANTNNEIIDKAVGGKQDKVQGKGLSTNDFTTEYKNKLDRLENYDDTEIRERIETVKGIADNNTSTIQELNETKADAEDVEALQTRVTELEQENEDLKKNQLTNTPEKATSHYLQDSADARFRKFLPIGRTTQESTSGANLQKFSEREAPTYNYKCDKKGQVTINGNISSYVSLGYNLSTNPMFLSAGTYKLKVIGTISSNTSILLNGNTGVTLDNNQEYLLTLNSDTSSFYIALGVNTGTHNDNFYITLASGNTATTERYTGGEPAPNPNYPIEIKNTGDEGSVNEKIQNKNYADYTKVKGTYQTTVSLIENGFKVVGSYAGSLIVSGLKKNTTYYLSYIRENITSSVTQVTVYNADASTAIKQLASSGTFNTGNNITVNIWFYAGQGTSKEANFTNIQVEEGSTATSYVPHSEQNLSFPLAEGQKFYEGEELKENEKDDIWSEYIFTGEENWTLYSETENVLKAYSIGPKLGRTNNMESTEDAFCTHFKNNVFYSSTNGIGLTQNATYVSVSKTIASNVSELKSWFATQYTNETPVKVQYKKKNPTTTPYTEEQKTAWKEWKKARTYKNVTHISSEDETPANVEIEYVRDLETVINNLTTRVETIESEV